MNSLLKFFVDQCHCDIETIRTKAERQTGMELIKLKGDASSRSYYRLSQGGASLILMVLPDTAAKSEEGESAPIVSKSLPFVEIQTILKQIGVRVPDILHTNMDKGVLILEDLGDQTLYELLASDKGVDIRPWYEQAIRQMATMHEAGTVFVCTHDSIVRERIFDEQLYRWEFEHFSEYGLFTHDIYRGQKKSPTVSEREKLAVIYNTISRRLFSLETVFTHRDFHSRNLMVVDQELVNIDFQDALMAPRAYDLASLLYDAYVELSVNERQEFIEEYGKAVGLSVENTKSLVTNVHLMAVQRTLKAAGRFEFLQAVKGNKTLAPFIPNALANARAALSFFPEYGFLDEMIERYAWSAVRSA